VFTVETFHELNPEWQIYVHVPIQDYKLNAKYIPDYKGVDYFPLISSMDFINIMPVNIYKYGINEDLHNILRSDIFRYHILYDEGGMWADFDIIWLKPMSHMNNINYVGKIPMKEVGATAHFYNTIDGHYGIGILFTVQHHSFYTLLIDKTVEVMNRNINADKYNHQAFGSVMWLELYTTLSDVIASHPDMVGVPYETFAPYGIYDLDRLYNKTDLSVINNNVIGLHWFNGHQLSKDYINNGLFNKNFQCSMTSILKQRGFMED